MKKQVDPAIRKYKRRTAVILKERYGDDWFQRLGASHTKNRPVGMGVGSGIYNSWAHMKRRCLNNKHPYYKDYGGRGITVCERWLDFDNFLDDMGKSWNRGLSIGRIDNHGNYEPSNCRWENQTQQANNTRANRKITFRNITRNLAEWSKEYNLGVGVLSYRLRVGWDIEKALTTPALDPSIRWKGVDNVQEEVQC